MNIEHDPKIDQEAEQFDHKENEQNENCFSELMLWKDQCKRISAEFENFKKRTERDQVRWAEMAKESILIELISFVDTFQAALSQLKNVDVSGIEMIYNSLLKLLEKHEVVMIKNYEMFDPEFHEAVIQVEDHNKKPGEIVEVFSQGFLMKGRVLRPAKVSVAK